MKKIVTVLLVLLLAGMGFATISSIQPINNTFDTNKCFLLQPKSFVDDDSGLTYFGFPEPNAVADIAPELTLLTDPYSPYNSITNPAYAVNNGLIFHYCLEPFKKMKTDLTDVNTSLTSLKTKVNDLNSSFTAKKQIISMQITAGLAFTCNTACANKAADLNMSLTCVHADTLLGIDVACNAILGSINCDCKEV